MKTKAKSAKHDTGNKITRKPASGFTYKGYTARVQFDADDEIFFGRLGGISDIISFHADSVQELKQAFHEAVDDYIATCAKIGKPPQKAYSGQLMFRVAPEVHFAAATAAELAGKSLNSWAEEALRSAAGLPAARSK